MVKKVNLFLASFLILINLYGQANGYGVKAGPGLGLQRWSGSDRAPLFVYHVDAFADSESESGNVLYGQLGYHLKGSALRINQFIDVNGNIYPGSTFGMHFHNAVLELGMKKFFRKGKLNAFYGLGLRGEYTVKTKFEFYQEYKDFVQRWNYGVSLRIGTEFFMSKFVRSGLEVHIAPDISRQIFVPQGVRYYDPRTNTTSPGVEQSVRNTVIELSFYLRFLQIIEYID